MQQKRLDVRDGMFSTAVLEGGNGSPILFLHGTNGLRQDRFLNLLADKHRVIAPFHPGFGDSTGTERLIDLFDLLYYYLDFLDATGLEGIPVVGHSLGAMFALELAAMQPKRFSKLALIAPLGLWNPAHPVADIFAMLPHEVAELTYYDRNSENARAAAEVPDETAAYADFMVERAKSMSTSAKYLFPIPNRGLNKRLHRVTAPSLLVWGAGDRICPPAYADDFRAYMPQAEVTILPHSGYLPQDEQPEELAGTILSFLD